MQQAARPGRALWCEASVTPARRALLGLAAQRTGKAGQVLSDLHEVHVLGQRPVARMHLPTPAGPVSPNPNPVRCDVPKQNSSIGQGHIVPQLEGPTGRQGRVRAHTLRTS